MLSFDEIKTYTSTICEQIRWKKARPFIASEIENHIYDQRDAYMSDGDDEATATNKAIEQMGDAVSIGLELDKTHKPKAQWSLIILTGILMLIGAFVTYYIDTSKFSLNKFSIIPFIIAFGIFLICYYLDFTILGKYAITFYFAVLGVSILALFVSSEINGRAVWVFSRFSINLSYLSLIFPLVFALLVYAMRNRGYLGIILSGIGFCPLAIILSIIPTASGLILFTISSFAILSLSIFKGLFEVNKIRGLLLILIPAVIISLLAVLTIMQNGYYSSRMNTFWDPYSEIYGAGYVYVLLREFLSHAAFLGKGSIPQIAGDLSATMIPSMDYSLAFLIHHVGLLILFVIITIIIVFSVISIYKISKQKNVLGFLVSLSILLAFALQSVSDILANLGYGLVSALSLPFISYGKTALFINAALIRFMLSVFRTGDIYKDDTIFVRKEHSFLSYKDGKITIDLRG